jgi:hypothetical protein
MLIFITTGLFPEGNLLDVVVVINIMWVTKSVDEYGWSIAWCCLHAECNLCLYASICAFK